MARWNKAKQKEQKRAIARKSRQFVWNNGGGTEPYKVKCEGCGHTYPGEETHTPLTPCLICGSETALYEPQLR